MGFDKMGHHNERPVKFPFSMHNVHKHAKTLEWNSNSIQIQSFKYSPTQTSPDPVYPVLHVHTKEPGVFIHMALTSQGLSSSHSLISAGNNRLANRK
jgi:hypothetical protein